MKVVINTCFGGFDLSPKAVKMIMEKKGMECHAYGVSYSTRKLYKFNYDESNPPYAYIFYSKVDAGDVIDINDNSGNWYHQREIGRTDKDLVETVERLGEEANGSLSNLKVVEIPDDVEWEIHECDGAETIHEKHRVWG